MRHLIAFPDLTGLAAKYSRGEVSNKDFPGILSLIRLDQFLSRSANELGGERFPRKIRALSH